MNSRLFPRLASSIVVIPPGFKTSAQAGPVGGPKNDHQEHVQKAAGGAKIDPLLARNLPMHFMGNNRKTASEILAKELE